jgi:hypothetical protein
MLGAGYRWQSLHFLGTQFYGGRFPATLAVRSTVQMPFEV